MTSVQFILLLTAALTGLTGCSIPTQSGRFYPVIGIGFIRVDDMKPVVNASGQDEAKVEQVDVKGAVVAIGPAVNGIVVGKFTRQTVMVPTDANLLIESRSDSDGSLHVKAKAFPSSQESAKQTKKQKRKR